MGEGAERAEGAKDPNMKPCLAISMEERLVPHQQIPKKNIFMEYLKLAMPFFLMCFV